MHPVFLSRAARLSPKQKVRARKLAIQESATLGARCQVEKLALCPECLGAGLHKARCGFYTDRAGLQVQTNPHRVWNGYLGGLASGLMRQGVPA